VPYLPAYSLLLPLRPLPARGRSLSSRLSPTPTRQGPPLLLLLSPCPLPLALRSLPCSLPSSPAALSPYRPHSYPPGATLTPPVSLLAYGLTPATIRLISAPLPPSPLEDRQEAGSLPCLASALTPFSAPPPTRQGLFPSSASPPTRQGPPLLLPSFLPTPTRQGPLSLPLPRSLPPAQTFPGIAEKCSSSYAQTKPRGGGQDGPVGRGAGRALGKLAVFERLQARLIVVAQGCTSTCPVRQRLAFVPKS